MTDPDRVAALQKRATLERQPTYGNGRCACGHLSDRHDCDRDNSDTACVDCACGCFTWDGTPIPPPIEAHAPQVEALKALVEKWRADGIADEKRLRTLLTGSGTAIRATYEQCADELDELVAAGAPEEDEPIQAGPPWTDDQLTRLRAFALRGDLRSARTLLESNGFQVIAVAAGAQVKP